MSALVPVPITPAPGVVVTESDRVAEGRWILPFDKSRFVHGRPQKIGGNVRVTSTAMSGTPRATLCWQDFNANGYVACGTYRKLYAFDSSFALNDITPVRASGTLGANPFTATAGSSSIQVHQNGHGVNVGDTVIFSGAIPANTPSQYGDESSSAHFWNNNATVGSLAAYLAATNYTFTRNTNASFINSSGFIATASNNVQRIDYDPLLNTAKGYLSELISTNLLVHSNAFTSTWLLVGSGGPSLSQNAMGPDGNANTAWTLTQGTTGNIFVSQSYSPGASTVSLSIWVKQGTANYAFLGFTDGGGQGYASFNLSTGSFATVNWQSGSPTGTVGNAYRTAYLNGWYRLSITWTGSTPTQVRFGIADADGSLTASGGKTGLFFGAQSETQPSSTSYIPTTTASVQRNADILNRPRAFTPTALTKLITGTTPSGALTSQPGAWLWDVDGGSNSNYIGLSWVNGVFTIQAYVGLVPQFIVSNSVPVPANTAFQVAFTVSTTFAAISVNGGTPITLSGTFTLPTCTQENLGLVVGGGQWGGCIAVDAEWSGIQATAAQLQTLSSSTPTTGGDNIPSWLPYMLGIQNMDGASICNAVIDTNNYTVTTPTTSLNSEGFGGPNVAYQYEISVGTELGAFGQGWGVGPWGLGTWGTARQGGIFQEPRVWSLDHFGQVLVATYNGGSLWFFDPTQNQPWPRAVATFGGNPVIGAPTNCRYAFITPERFIFALSANMVVNVCSQGDPTTWIPATTNTAFARTLQIGTKLVAGRVLAPFISMVWSDSAAYLFQYTGSQFIYNSSVAGVDCGLISPNAAVTVDGFAYWMGPDNFYFYNGTVGPMPNVEDIRKYVFEAIPSNVSFQCAAVYVPKYHEIWWFYPAGTGATNPTNYVIYHINDQCWSVGTANFYSSPGVTAGRASGSHFTQGDTSPIMASTDGYLANHDPISLSYDDNGNPLTWTWNLAPLAMNEGLENVEIEGIVWDFFEQAGDITTTVNMFDRLTDLAPIDTDTETAPASQAGITDYRAHGRYAGLTITQGVLGGYARLGKPVIFAKTAGTRR